MLAVLGLQIIDNLCSPRPLHTMRAVAARRFDADTPVGKSGVRVVVLQHMREVHDRSAGCAERIRQAFHMRNCPDQKRHVDFCFGMFPSDMAKAPIPMQKIVLHVDNDQSRLPYVWTGACRHHFVPPSIAECTPMSIATDLRFLPSWHGTK